MAQKYIDGDQVVHSLTDEEIVNIFESACKEWWFSLSASQIIEEVNLLW